MFSTEPFLLYRGVIEDNNHPDKNGMVRVRIKGLHTEKNENNTDKFEFIATNHLPWAEVMQGTGFGLVGGVGLSTVLQQGTWVWVVLENNDPNKPIVVGTITGQNSSSPSSKYANGEGFFDPQGKFPYSARSSELDINRIARNDNLGTTYYDEAIKGSTSSVHKKINDAKDTVTKTDATTTASVSQIEPDSLNNLSTYPNVSVLETPSGHVIELDDTAGNERLRLYHRSGSYVEFRPDGSIVQKSRGTAPDHFIHENAVNEHIAKGVKRYIEENFEEIILGGIKSSVEMDLFKHIGGAFKITANGNLEISNSVKIIGDLECSGEVADSQGNLSSLRNAYDAHYHIGNLGVPTALPTNTDPKTRVTVTITPLGFKP